MPEEPKPVTCPKCTHRSDLAIIDLSDGRLYCSKCRAPLPMAPMPDPRRPPRTDAPCASALAARVRAGRLKRLLMAFGDDRDLISGTELHKLWRGPDDYTGSYDVLDDSIGRLIRRYNQTLRRIGAGFTLRYSRAASALIRVPLEQ